MKHLLQFATNYNNNLSRIIECLTELKTNKNKRKKIITLSFLVIVYSIINYFLVMNTKNENIYLFSFIIVTIILSAFIKVGFINFIILEFFKKETGDNLTIEVVTKNKIDAETSKNIETREINITQPEKNKKLKQTEITKEEQNKYVDDFKNNFIDGRNGISSHNYYSLVFCLIAKFYPNDILLNTLNKEKKDSFYCEVANQHKISRARFGNVFPGFFADKKFNYLKENPRYISVLKKDKRLKKYKTILDYIEDI